MTDLHLRGTAIPDDPWHMIVEDVCARTCLGLIGGIHISRGHHYIGLVVPSRFMSFLHVKSVEVLRDGEDDKLDIIMEETT